MVAKTRASLQAPEADSAIPKRLPTAFEQRLYAVCKAVPRGKVATYGLLAKATNSSPRAVGQALRRNPFAPEVPCHRVIASSLELGGFRGDWGDTPQIMHKKQMLEAEGVCFHKASLVSAEYVVDFSSLPSV